MSFTRNKLYKFISLVLAIITLLITVGCSNAPPTATLSNEQPMVLTEKVEIEDIIIENTLTEFITTEISLQELVVVEDRITELLLEEETITEVLCCETIYIPQGHIDDFASNSKTAQLFGEGINLKSVLTKFAVGTGVILTLVVLKKANVPEPISSMIVAAADKSLGFAAALV